MKRAVSFSGAVLVGIEAVAVALDIVPTEEARGLVFDGWLEASARELRVRVSASLDQLGYRPEGFLIRAHGVPPEWLGGDSLDLAVAVGLCVAMGELERSQLGRVALVGGLSLGGELRPVRGAFVIGRAMRAAGVRLLVGAQGNGDDFVAVGGLRVCSARTLRQVLDVLRGVAPWAHRLPLERELPERWPAGLDRRGYGQAYADAQQAVDGGARVLVLEGPEGYGQMALVRALWGGAPPLGPEDWRDVYAVQGAAGLTRAGTKPPAIDRPFRAPHHTVSEAGLVGGGEKIRPGELSLATHGVLYLDDLGEFRRTVLDAVAVALRSGEVTFQRYGRTLRLPARPWLVVCSVRPCPCGWALSDKCRCSREQIARYRGRDYGRFGELVELVIRVGGGA